MFFFYNYDIWGSVTSIINPDGSRVKGYDYDAFGRTQEVGNPLFANDVKFTGAVQDQASGLYYMNARFYNPSTGRFLTQDSYSGNPAEPWTQHLYTYGGNNPVNMIDPTGHAFTLAIASIISWASLASGLAVAGYTAYKSYKDTGKVDLLAAVDAGVGTALAVYTLATAAYSLYAAVSMYCGVAPATTVTIGSSASKTKSAAPTSPVPTKTETNVTAKASTAGKTASGSTAAKSTGGSVVSEGAGKTSSKMDLQLFSDGAGKADIPSLPNNARVLKDPKAVYNQLEKYHGIDPKLASERLHGIKQAAGRGPADNVIFDMTGNVFDPRSKEWLGSLTQGGAKGIMWQRSQ